MDNETATALTDVILSAGTLVLALNSTKTWKAFFFALALAAGLGALFHGTAQFHTKEVWSLTTASTIAGAFLFLAACAGVARPGWSWLGRVWPLWGVVGVLVGLTLANLPFFYVSIVSALCVLISALWLQKAPTGQARKWIYAGMLVTLLGFVLREVTNFPGLLCPNGLFHLVQLGGNVLFWMGARRS